MDVLKIFTVRLCPWDMHLTGRRRGSGKWQCHQQRDAPVRQWHREGH